MRRYVWALAPVILGALPTHAAGCPAEHAHYRQAGSHGFTAAFVAAGNHGTAASNLFFVVRSRNGNHWFRFQVANGYGGISLEAITDPAISNPDDGPQPLDTAPGRGPDEKEGRNNAFIPYRANLTEIQNPPQAGDNAPPIIVLPDLGARLWYDTGTSADRLFMSRAAFRLTACTKRTKARRG
ncbi:MAG TPA: hypothetical protein VNQ56_17920 [Pseudolabrys sp.]|nr:hypothetical protein [Pseudolabrys sp.]